MTYKLQNKTLIDYFGNTVNTAARLEANVSPQGGFAIGASKKNIAKVVRSITETFGDKLKIDYLVFKDDCKKIKKCKSTKNIKGVQNIEAVTAEMIPKKKKTLKLASRSFSLNSNR